MASSPLLWLTQDADVRCAHRLGVSPQQPSQGFVRVEGRLVLVSPDPVGRPIGGCPHIGAAIMPCTTTLAMRAGESGFVRIAGDEVIRADLDGYTNGTPPGAVHYRVVDPAQSLVGEQP